MVQAVLDDRKKQTRRLIKPKYKDDEAGFQVCANKSTGERWIEKHDDEGGSFDSPRYVLPKYQVGDILYVRETFYQHGEWHDKEVRNKHGELKIKHVFIPCGIDKPIYFVNTLPSDIEVKKGFTAGRGYYKRPSIFMPKEAARIFLKMTDDRAEQLHDITVEDAVKEGYPHEVNFEYLPIAQQGLIFEWYKSVWDGTLKPKDIEKYSMDANPWVWVYEFERIETP